jgi:hypothetical protein
MNQKSTVKKFQQSSLNLENNNNNSIITKKSTFHTFKVEFNDALKDLKKSNFARIDGDEFSCETIVNYITGCQFEEIFKVFLTDENEERQCFTCRETSECFQRTCIKKNNRQFSMDCFYIEESVDNIKNMTKPFMKVERINGGCCPGRAEIHIFDGEGDMIGYVKEEPVAEGHIATIYDKRNVMLYEIKSQKPRINRSDSENCFYVCCCCGCCGLCPKEKQYRQFNVKEENNFKIFDKSHKQVGEIKYPCSIIFTNVEEPIDKFLIILSRIFMVYFLDRTDTFVEKSYDLGRDTSKDCMKVCCPCCGCC